ncbi:cupin domain-containing protein [Hymenobacter edaphi]|uniref:Cupin n=1 Tax=Hymenobacter edaphi TaxID=2211146 RepID=A0A328BYJ5_9BACT|nr:cupin domain-containing protein [Hymenobacter edaphi]RAK70218.1 cupin [Hymenobacter edaphi]
MKRRTFLGAAAVLPWAAAGVPFSLTGESSPSPFVVKAGQNRRNEVLTFRRVNRQDVKVSADDTGQQLSVLQYSGREKVGPPLHIHYHQDEIFYIVEGQYRFVVGTEEFVASTGDTVFLPRNVPHTWIQLTETGKQLYLLQPAGKFEEFLRKLQGLAKPPAAAELRKIHLEHGMKILGPPLQL